MACNYECNHHTENFKKWLIAEKNVMGKILLPTLLFLRKDLGSRRSLGSASSKVAFREGTLAAKPVILGMITCCGAQQG